MIDEIIVIDQLPERIDIYDPQFYTGKNTYELYLLNTTDVPPLPIAAWLAQMKGKSQYQSYLATTLDNPKKSEAVWSLPAPTAGELQTQIVAYSQPKKLITELYTDAGEKSQIATIQDKQDSTDNTLNTTSKTVAGAINEVRGFALEIPIGKVFATKADLDLWLTTPANKASLKNAQNLFIIALNTPDYWWDFTGQVYYELESKLDLSGYLTAVQIAAAYQPLKNALELYVSQVEKNIWNAKQDALSGVVTTHSHTVDLSSVPNETIQSIGTLINSSLEKTDLVDADKIPISDSADLNKLKWWSYAKLKLQLSGFFATLSTSQTITAAKTFNADTLISPNITGGSAIGSNITYKPTTGIGMPTGIAHQFVGGTNGATVLATMLNNGNVGIGTTTPQYLLSLGANSKGFSEYMSGGAIFDAIKVVGNNLGANFGTQNLNVGGFSGVEYMDNTGSVVVFTGYKNGGTGEFRFNNLATNGFIVFKIAGRNELIITNSGNVGIGAPSPQSKLDVTGDLNIKYIYQNNGVHTGDAIGDIRHSNQAGVMLFQKCTVANAVKGSGTWIALFTITALGAIKETVVEYASNAAAITAGLEVGTHYRTGEFLKIVY